MLKDHEDLQNIQRSFSKEIEVVVSIVWMRLKLQGRMTLTSPLFFQSQWDVVFMSFMIERVIEEGEDIMFMVLYYFYFLIIF